MTTTGEAKRLVIGAMGVAGVVAAAGDLAGGHAPQLRIFIGAVVAAAVLSMIAEFSPEGAQMFAVLILVSALIAGGPNTYAKVQKITAGTPTQTTQKAGRPS